MDRSQLVHVVALVRAGTCVHEREHTCYEQRTFMVCHGEGTCEDGTCFAVFALAVAEKQRVRGRITVPQPTGLSHEAACQHSPVIHVRTAGYDEVLADDAMSDVYRGFGPAVDTAVIQSSGT